jgi:hypothetical protein
LRTKGAGFGVVPAFLPVAALRACKVSSDARSERAVETGEERIGSARAGFAFARFASGAAEMLSGAGFAAADLDAAVPARAADARERAGTAWAVSAALEEAGDRLVPIG